MGVCIDWGEAALRETANVGEFSMFFLTLSLNSFTFDCVFLLSLVFNLMFLMFIHVHL